jgi:hypothetical protein
VLNVLIYNKDKQRVKGGIVLNANEFLLKINFEKKTDYLGARIKPSLKEKLIELCDNDKVSLTQKIEEMILKEINRKETTS